MIDLVLKWSVDGQQKAVQSAKEVSAEVNKSFGERQQQRQAEWSKRQAQYARESRKESFAKLSIEEKLLRLTERRAQTERFIARAEAQGNTYRAQALRLRLAQVNQAIPMFQRPGFGSSFTSMAFPTGAFFGGAAGGGVGAFLGAGLGMAVGAIVRAFGRVAMASFRLADDLDNTSEMLGVSRADVLRVQEAAAMAGVPQRASIRGLSRLGQARSAALSGDEEMQRLFANYGVDAAMLRDSDNLQIGQAIRRSLGAAGMQAGEQRNMERIFGEVPGRMLALLNTISLTADSAEMEDRLKKLDQTNLKFEKAGNALSRLWANATYYAVKAIENPGISGPLSHAMTVGSAIANLPPPNTAANLPRTAGEFTVGVGSKQETKDAQLSPFAGRSAADALTRIGLFLGGNTATIVRLDRQITELRRIVRELGLLNRNVQEDA